MSAVRSPEASLAQDRPRLITHRWLVVPVVLGLLLGGATAWKSMGQSLWIDELHTAWAASGSWEQVVSRAAIGNQTPVYFAWQWWLSRTFGQTEVCLRATSLVAWLASLATLAAIIHRLVQRTGQVGLWWLFCLAALDRQQIFFATEARPYMVMSLVVLWGWVALDRALVIDARQGAAGSNPFFFWILWISSAVVALWLQPVAILFVSAQVAIAVLSVTGLVARASALRGRWWWIALVAVLLISACWPMRYVLQPAWQGRQAWAAFAADLRWQNILNQLPIVVLVVPGMAATAISWFRSAQPRQAVHDRSSGQHHADYLAEYQAERYERDDQAKLSELIYWLAWAMPLANVIGLTALGIAPLMHARYLFAATLPLTVWSASQIARLRSGLLVTALGVGMLSLQIYQQGSWNAWKSGRLATVARAEGWRGAVAHMERLAAQPSTNVQIYCASNLIEGSHSQFLDGSQLRREYLTLPLQSLYAVPQQAQIVPLLNDPNRWPAVISSQPAAENTSGSQRWLLVRCSAAGLSKRLQASGFQALEHQDFGEVQLVRF